MKRLLRIIIGYEFLGHDSIHFVLFSGLMNTRERNEHKSIVVRVAAAC